MKPCTQAKNPAPNTPEADAFGTKHPKPGMRIAAKPSPPYRWITCGKNEALFQRYVLLFLIFGSHFPHPTPYSPVPWRTKRKMNM